MAEVLRVNALELLRHPGARKTIELTITAAELGVIDERVAGEIAIALVATSSVDGIVLRGTVSTPWHGQCRRCLIDVGGVAVAEVDELYQEHPRHDEATAIVGDQIDVAPLAAEYVILELPDHPLCRLDCAGICPTCGVDRNVDSCECDDTIVDPRWSGLEQLRFDD